MEREEIDSMNCHHDWNGDEIMTFHNDERILFRAEFDSLSESERILLNPASGEVSCSKCRIGYTICFNPYLLEF